MTSRDLGAIVNGGHHDTTNVVLLRPAAEPRDTELAALTEQVRALTETVTELAERQARVEERLPPVALPENWVSVKVASKLCSYSQPTLYRFCRLGLIDSRPIGGRVAIDSSTLARRLAEHLAKRKKKK
jgi:hypothetical protein